MDRSGAATPPVPQEFTHQYFDSFEDLSNLPAPYKRKPQERVFVTRDLNMHSINYVGCLYKLHIIKPKLTVILNK